MGSWDCMRLVGSSAWLGLAWLGLAWLGLARLGLARIGGQWLTAAWRQAAQLGSAQLVLALLGQRDTSSFSVDEHRTCVESRLSWFKSLVASAPAEILELLRSS